MSNSIDAGAILIKAGTLMPEFVRVKAGPYWQSWKVIEASDGATLDQSIRKAGWNFFFLSASLHALAWGHGGGKTFRRAIQRVLAKAESSKFNCLEITEVAAKRFLGIPYVLVSAHSRHIQKSCFLQSPEQGSRAAAAASWATG